MKNLKIFGILLVCGVVLAGDCFAAIPPAIKDGFSAKVVVRGTKFTNDDKGTKSTFAKVKVSPKLDVDFGESSHAVISADLQTQIPDPEVYEEGIELKRSDGKKPVALLQEAYVEAGAGDFTFKQGKFRPQFRGEIQFDFTNLSPFAQLDSSEPFLSLDDDRLLGSWGGVVTFEREGFGLEFIGFAHEDPILATHESDPWTRALPYGMDYGSFQSGSEIDWGVRLSGYWWEFSFFRGSSNSPNHLILGDAGELDLVFPEQTTLESAFQVPVGPFNFRAGASHNWRSWQDENAGQFFNVISELELLKEGVFRGGDNLLLEIGFADVWDTDESELLQEGLGIDQIYRGGSLLFTTEYSPTEDWVLKIRSIFNLGNGSSYISPEIRKLFFTDSGDWEVYFRAMIIDGSSNDDDVISNYSENDNFEFGVQLNFW